MATSMNGGMNAFATMGAGRAQMTGAQQPMGMAQTAKPMGMASTGAREQTDTRQPMGMASTGMREQPGVTGNGGGPEPHQGSNPGAQSDPGSKEIGYYDTLGDHMGGDDGVQNTAERPSPMRMGGVQGTPPNAGQRGGQNTGSSGAQTTNYSSEEEYGAGSVPGVTGSTGAYQSRAASKLATANGGSGAMGARMDEPAQAFRSTPASRGREDEGVMDKAQGFASNVKDKVEDFFNVDLDQDGSIGGTATDTQMQGQDDPRTPGTYPYNERRTSSGARSDASHQGGTGGFSGGTRGSNTGGGEGASSDASRQAGSGGLTANTSGGDKASTGWKGATNAAGADSQKRHKDLVSA